ncbi:MAG: hypothetical protein AAF675_11720 [Pseudomonadota bacterium]
MLPLTLATLLFVEVPAGVAVEPAPGAIFLGLEEAAIALVPLSAAQAEARIESAKMNAATGTAQPPQADRYLGYRMVDIATQDGIERLLIVGDAALAFSASSPANAPTAAPEALAALRDWFSPGDRAGRSADSLTIRIDGMLLEDATLGLPPGFFDGPVTIDISDAAAE